MKLGYKIIYISISSLLFLGCDKNIIDFVVNNKSQENLNSIDEGGTTTTTTTSTTTTTLPICSTVFSPATNMAATVVIGQANFNVASANRGGAAGANTINTSDGVSVLSDGSLYIGEFSNRRYLIYNSIPTSNGTSADRVFGQPDFSTTTANTGGISGLSMQSGRNVAWNGSQFFLGDPMNHRILVWNALPTNSSTTPDYVIGQTTMTTNSNGGNNTGLDSGYGAIHATNTKLIVADTWVNYRVLIFDLPITSNLPLASVVVGQPNFSSYAGTTTADGVREPAQAIVYGGKLIVADRYNHRVIIFNSVPTTNGATADVVIGQANMTSGSSNRGGAVGANTLSHPHSVAVDDQGRLYIADTFNHRILVYNSVPTASGTSADFVIGQANFTSNSANSGAPVSANSLYRPTAVHFGACSLVVADQQNHRVLIYK